jgi:uncharacterized membrane protein YccF (DUF307 family)
MKTKFTGLIAFFGFGVFTTGLGYLLFEPIITLITTTIGLGLILFAIKYYPLEK